MKTTQITISAFFFVCLFNVAFIPQLCLNAVEDLQHKEITNNILGEESTSGLNIFEEESKESSKESSENENNNLNLKALGQFRASLHNIIHESLVNNIFRSNFYQSIPILKTTPPPKV
ncbi:hypothetical protein MATR_09610 [Marivirga tractuosa]|uniref:Uncharacterized protein n=1 Tax=Marivirga tractuosa (strain ATCC 23168 / DSM 4126 / NBRC 15989 / NCIMB 1408 / VKM B-1430 / H-43) TaxID=643867 RepID=E4TMX9_MARTH|nr:hypothetical protein [Marivirga tractuosa]ADR21410.1 hypothetical protein Ftrac_1420 [Marivirga tractuosa DSM 4126]BDD14136.1 hypothetical protein MATR_09610 [Marivirga tractuosa]